MRKIALTGNIAAGKSAVEKILLSLGYKVLDTDVVGHELLQENKEIRLVFKDFDILEDNQISRAKLGQIVFNDAVMLSKLNSIIHPQIKQRIKEFFIEHEKEKMVFVSVPLLFESGMQDLFDETVLIYADDQIRLDRIINRNGFTKEFAQKRMQCQMSQQEKMLHADFVIENNETLEELKEKIMHFLTNHSF